MSESDLAILKELKALLGKKVSLIQMRLFGSRARGDHAADSDMDVFVEVERLSSAEKIKIKEAAWEVSLKHGRVITPLIFSRHELVDTPLRSASIVQNILREGIVI
jgi:predicted nucleotidyltransferase